METEKGEGGPSAPVRAEGSGSTGSGGFGQGRVSLGGGHPPGAVNVEGL